MSKAYCPIKKWLSQYDLERVDATGRAEGPGACNMTSAAMVLVNAGILPPGPYSHAGDNLLKYCDDNGLDRHSLDTISLVINHFGLKDVASYTDSLADVKRHLDQGKPTIVQGCFTKSGHVIVVNGYDEAKGEWVCNDPAGCHTSSGYDGYASGHDVRYPSAWFDPAAAPDGKVWAHLLG